MEVSKGRGGRVEVEMEMETEREMEKVILLICSYLAGIAVSDAVA